MRERNDLEPIVEAFQAYRQAEQDMLDAQELMADPEMRELCQEEYPRAKKDLEELDETMEAIRRVLTGEDGPKTPEKRPENGEKGVV